MTYYEELGVEPSASAEEIHRAHRNLCRLLHPDHQGDENLRRLAECQMRRLNAIRDLLLDASRRSGYDSSLVGEPVGEEPGIGARRAKRGAARLAKWLAAAIGGIAAISWFWSGERLHSVKYPAAAESKAPWPATRESRPVSRQAAPRIVVTVDERLRSQLEAARRERDAAFERAAWLEGELARERALRVVESSPPQLPREGVEPTTTGLPPPAPQGPPRGFRGAPLAGTWYYSPAAESPAASLYPPEFVEAVIVEAAGVLRGRYRARYRVRDRAISPEVAFRFEGPARGPSAKLAWRSHGGARGEVHLRLVSESRMEVEWAAAVLGELGLSAGTAVLVRQE